MQLSRAIQTLLGVKARLPGSRSPVEPPMSFTLRQCHAQITNHSLGVLRHQRTVLVPRDISVSFITAASGANSDMKSLDYINAVERKTAHQTLAHSCQQYRG